MSKEYEEIIEALKATTEKPSNIEFFAESYELHMLEVKRLLLAHQDTLSVDELKTIDSILESHNKILEKTIKEITNE